VIYGEQVFSLSASVFPCQFHSTTAPLHGKTEKSNHLHHRVHHKENKKNNLRKRIENLKILNDLSRTQ
jgi:hypothetical protein